MKGQAVRIPGHLETVSYEHWLKESGQLEWIQGDLEADLAVLSVNI